MTELFVNSTFAAWPLGQPRGGAFMKGAEVCKGWRSKWSRFSRSRTVCSPMFASGGMRHEMWPGPGVTPGDPERFSLSQPVHPVTRWTEKSFRATCTLRLSDPGNVSFAWDASLRWNNEDRLTIVDGYNGLFTPITNEWVDYTVDFTTPPGSGVFFAITESSGIDLGILLAAPEPAVAFIRQISLVQL